MKTQTLLLIALTAAGCLFAAASARAQVTLADVRANYATSGTLADTFGTGTWTYYASTTADPSAGTLTALSYQSIGNAGNNGYGDSATGGYAVPAVSNLPIFGDGAATGTDSLAWHPGNGSPEYTVIRWTAGTGEAGAIHLQGTFSGVGEPGGATEFYVFVNGVQAYGQPATGGGRSYTYDLTASIASGESVDFVLGNGGNGYGGDESLISGTVSSAIPEPAAYGVCAGLATLGLVALRRRRG